MPNHPECQAAQFAAIHLTSASFAHSFRRRPELGPPLACSLEALFARASHHIAPILEPQSTPSTPQKTKTEKLPENTAELAPKTPQYTQNHRKPPKLSPGIPKTTKRHPKTLHKHRKLAKKHPKNSNTHKNNTKNTPQNTAPRPCLFATKTTILPPRAGPHNPHQPPHRQLNSISQLHPNSTIN